MSESAKQPLVIFAYVVLTLSTLLVFWQVHSFDFLSYDDQRYVYENPHVTGGLSLDGIVWAFTTGHASNWHPLTWVSHMLDCQLFGSEPGPMHLVNLLLHLANTLLLFTVLRRMTGSLWPSAFVAAAFALHPMHVESVAWIAERKDVLSTFFLLLTLAAYVGHVKRPSKLRYLFALVFFAFGLMAKPMLVTLPFLLLLLDYWPLNRFDKTARRKSRKHDGDATLRWIIVEKIPFFVLAAVSSAITYLVQRAGGAVADSAMLPLGNRIANALVSYTRYIGKMFWPRDLAVFYPLPLDHVAFWKAAACFVLLLAITILVIRLGRRQKYLPVGWFWFIGTLVPVIGLVQVGMQALADRYSYIPYIGLFIMIAWGLPEFLSKWPYRKIALGLSMAVLLATLGICAHRQTSYWRSGVLLFSHAIEVTHDNYVAYINRATAYGKLDSWPEAMADYNHAAAIMPDSAKAHYDLASVYSKLGRWQEAIEQYDLAIGLEPRYDAAYNDRGAAYGKLGRRAEAMDSFRQAIKFNQGNAEARDNLAKELTMNGEYDEAADQYRAALRIRPDWIGPMNNLAWLIAAYPQIKNRDTSEAVRLASRACELSNDRDPALLDTLAGAYASAGRFSEAVDKAQKALGLVDEASQLELKNIIRQHLSFYKQGKPYIEPDRANPPDANKP